jgi:hypothetical protein
MLAARPTTAPKNSIIEHVRDERLAPIEPAPRDEADARAIVMAIMR